MSYTKTLRYLNSFLNFEKISKFSYHRELNLERMQTVLRWFGNPQHHFHSILIAGTKGKGSSAFFMERLLSSHGFRVGLYTSPHLSDFRERIRIGSNLIPKSDLIRWVRKIRMILKRREHELRHMGPLTFFEMTTLLTFLYFSDKKVDWAVLEVGMGGRLDATNVVRQSLSMITLIGLDHQEHLGKTIRLIAREKAAIIKSRAPIVSARQTTAALREIKSRAKRQRAPLYLFGRHFRPQNMMLAPAQSRFDLAYAGRTLSKIDLHLPGSFQVENASLALAAFLILSEKFCFPINERDVREALRSDLWPGRFEHVRSGALSYLLDSAHNPESFSALSDNIKRLCKGKRLITIFGLSREKDLQTAYSILSSISDVMIMTKANQPRACHPKNMLEAIPAQGAHFICESIYDGIQIAKKIADQNTIILITGSLFLVGEARKVLQCKIPF